MRKTKIIATIGPSSVDYSVFKKLVMEGMNIVRINLSHASLDFMNQVYDNVIRVRNELKVPLPIMLDTKGPELRVGELKNKQVNIKKGQKFIFTGRKIVGDENIVGLNMPKLVDSIKVGDNILACNGLLVFKVIEKIGKDVITKAQNSGVLSSKKSLSVPNLIFNTPYLNSLDKADILWGIKHNVEILAASFVNSKADIISLQKFIAQNNGEMKIVAKIESKRGVENVEEIIDCADGVMVARGDLGVELPVEKLPQIQKEIINLARDFGKPVIVATEMLESMISSNRPTRAEVSDVANAVYDGTSAIMLSGESASGMYPVEAVKTMHKVALETEKNLDYGSLFESCKQELNGITDIISYSAVGASFSEDIKAIVVFTCAGLSARMISRFRPMAQIIGATPDEKTFRYLELLWGVKPVLTKYYKNADEMFKIGGEISKKLKFANTNDNIIITCGTPKENGCTNLIKVEKIK